MSQKTPTKNDVLLCTHGDCQNLQDGDNGEFCAKHVPKKELPKSYRIAGSSMVEAYTINSMYANGKIELLCRVDGLTYRIDVSELLKLIKREKFQANKKAKYYHLTLI